MFSKQTLIPRLIIIIFVLIVIPAQAEQPKKEEGGKILNILDMEFVWVPGGCYMMGSDLGGSDEKPVHKVCVNGFWIGKYEVTQGQYKMIMGKNPSYFKKGGKYPVEQVSWYDTQSFISALNSKTGKTFRLPTEAEWEYAARSGGENQVYSGGASIDNLAWFVDNSGAIPHEVGTKSPNGLGIYDMSGNMWEWCQDWYYKNYYANSSTNNPSGPSSGLRRVYRGGSWFEKAGICRSTFRYRNHPSRTIMSVGFRLVLLPGQ